MINAIWLLIGGVRGIAIAAAAVALSWAAWQAYDYAIDDPHVRQLARVEYVGIAELEAEKAKNKLLLELNVLQARNIKRMDDANAAFAEKLAAAESEKKDLQHEYDEMLAKPLDPAGLVGDGDLYNGLRGK
jgi:LPS O-antigen subunit length determinant protein (WzzB/FepE family)